MNPCPTDLLFDMGREQDTMGWLENARAEEVKGCMNLCLCGPRRPSLAWWNVCEVDHERRPGGGGNTLLGWLVGIYGTEVVHSLYLLLLTLTTSFYFTYNTLRFRRMACHPILILILIL